MTKTVLFSAAAFVLTAGIASASLYQGYPLDMDVNTLTDAQRAAVDLAVKSSDSTGEIVARIAAIA